MPEYHLRVYIDRSELVEADGSSVVFLEGSSGIEAVKRSAAIKAALDDGFLTREIEKCRDNPEIIDVADLSDAQRENISSLVSSMSSEVGRAIIGLSVLQLTIKTICQNQNIRLHKSGNRSTFGWIEGIPMRSLDATYITPSLRKYGLLKLNAFGFMMTRTLAENYPYSKVYKAGIRGGRKYWLQLVEDVESGTLSPISALRFIISQLLNSASEFNSLADRAILKLSEAIKDGKFEKIDNAISLFKNHMQSSQYAARIMEISMHSLMQSIEELGGLGSGKLQVLSQMRSANKKHGNIGDVEILDGKLITHSWDAKYGKTYLRDELEELYDKIECHPSVLQVGFVTSSEPDNSQEISMRIIDIEDATGLKISIESFDSWIENRFADALSLGIDESFLVKKWVQAYVESLAQRRSDIAPIDEPCFQWVESLEKLL